MAEIDAVLVQKPAVILFGNSWGTKCAQQISVLEGLVDQYPNVAFLYVNADKCSALTLRFGVDAVPQTEVLVKKNADGSYLYIGPDGQSTNQIANSRTPGTYVESWFKPIISAALAAR
jgi:thiol-disulfide isomerase/thioredoxin